MRLAQLTCLSALAAFAALATPALAAPYAVLTAIGTCAEPCAVPPGLAAVDADELKRLSSQVIATLQATADRATLPADKAAETLAAKLAGGDFDGDFRKVKTGKKACVVYWYGFLDNRSERVGRHQCRVSRKDGGLVIEKTTGDGLYGTLTPYSGRSQALVGRTYLSDHKFRRYDAKRPDNPENENFGNKVGLVLADKGKLYFLSINERGFTEPDQTFFELIAIE